MKEAGEKLGRPLNTCERAKEMMLAAGFIDVEEIRFIWPQNSWPKDKKLRHLGIFAQEDFTSGLEAMSLALFTHGLEWKYEEIMEFLVKVKADVKDRTIHADWPVYVVYGRRP